MKRFLVPIAVAAGILVVGSVPAFAAQSRGNSLNCFSHIAFVHARYSDVANITPPGGSLVQYGENDGLWHVRELNGGYSGTWQVTAYDLLDASQTYASCRTYG